MPNTLFHRFRSSWVVRQWDKLLFLVVFAGFFVFSPGNEVFTKLSTGNNRFPRLLPFVTPTPAPFPVNTSGIYPGLEVTGTGVGVYDLESGVFFLAAIRRCCFSGINHQDHDRACGSGTL